jgi:putative aldouronate transport system permease protein
MGLKKRTSPWITVFMVFLSILFVYPFYYILVLSFNEAYDSYRGGIYLWPRVWTLENYRIVLTNPFLANAYLITIMRVVLMTVLVSFLCSLYGYALIHREMIWRRFFAIFIIVPMYVGGGIIPFYFVLQSLRLIDSFFVYIIPYLFVPFYILLFRSYFQDFAPSMREAGIIDGCSEYRIFLHLILPVSIPVMAVVGLFTAVNNWNEWFVGQAFVTKSELWPLQTIMLQILRSQEMRFSGLTSESVAQSQGRVTPESVRITMIVVSVAPVLMVYPFLQRYFIHGIMIGAIKE